MKVPMSSPDLGEAEREAVMAVLRTPRLSMGTELEAFERALAAAAGARFAVGVSSGTTGLHLAVRATGVHDGDWVITTPFSFVASANAILYERALPVFVDVDPVTGNIDPGPAAEAAADLVQKGSAAQRWLPRRGVTEWGRLRALLAVDVFGQPADYDRLRRVTQEHALTLIEDACEALGASYHDRPAGRLGDIGVFGFYPNKQITTGEGGAVVTDDGAWAELVRAMTNQGRAAGDTWLEHSHLGFNYRLDEMSAALGRVQLGRLDELMAKRGRVAGWYAERLAGVAGVETPHTVPSTTRRSWFVYVIRLDPARDRREVAKRLEGLGIPTRPYFSPIHLQKYMREGFGYREGDYPVAEDLGRRSLALPFSSVMTEDQVDLVSQAVVQVVG
ncbi:MAG: DegT/DnrJ/EryC1/StrS family aminotransferase [Anaerolineales bacterium]